MGAIELILLVFCLAVVVGGVFVVKLIIKQMSGVRAAVDAARAEFLQKVGYAWASALGGDPSRTRSKQTPSGVLSHTFDARVDGTATTTVQWWHLAAKPPAQFQLIEKSLVGVGRAVLNVVGPISKTLTIKFPGPHLIGDPALDARFVLHAPDAASASALVRRAEVKAVLAPRRVIKPPPAHRALESKARRLEGAGRACDLRDASHPRRRPTFWRMDKDLTPRSSSPASTWTAPAERFVSCIVKQP